MRALLLDQLPDVSVASKTDAGRAVNGVKVTDPALVQALLNYGTYDTYYYVRISSKNAKSQYYRNSERLRALDLGSIESLPEKAPEEFLLFTSGHDLAKFVPFRQFCGHTDWPICGRTHGLSDNRLIPGYIWNYFAALERYDAIVCTSSAGRSALSRLFEGLATTGSVAGVRGCFPPRLQLSHIDGIDVEDYLQGRSHDSRENGFIVVSIGRLTASHKADLRPLILAFLRSSTLPASATLILAGDDTQWHIAPDLQVFANSIPSPRKVTLMPDISTETKFALLRMADVALPISDTYQETFGLSVLEAMAAGLPVVAPDWDGYRDLVVHEETGFLVGTSVCEDSGLLNAVSMLIDPSFLLGQRVMIDIQSVLHYLTLLSANSSLARKMGRQGRERAERHFSWRAVVQHLETLWGEQIQSAKGLLRSKTRRSFGYMDYNQVFQAYPESVIKKNAVVTFRRGVDDILKLARSGDLFSSPPVAGFSPQLDHRILDLCSTRDKISIGDLIDLVQNHESGPSMVTTQLSRLVVSVRATPFFRKSGADVEVCCMSESVVVSKVSRRSRAEADRLVLEFERSGMTRTAFCRTQGVSAQTLDYYRRMRRGKAEAAPRLVPVELVGASGGSLLGVPSQGARLRVELANGRQIVVEEGFSAALLKSVVAALEA